MREMITIESFKKLKIRKIQTILGAIEFAQAQGKKKRNGYILYMNNRRLSGMKAVRTVVLFHSRCTFQKI
jgi:hypothetical protein